MDGAARPKGLTIGNIISVSTLLILVLALGFLGAVLWLTPAVADSRAAINPGRRTGSG